MNKYGEDFEKYFSLWKRKDKALERMSGMSGMLINWLARGQRDLNCKLEVQFL